MALRVLIVDDDAAFRALIRALITNGRVKVVGEAADGDEAIRMVERLSPDIVLMDVSMPRRDGIEATEEIETRWPTVRVLMDQPDRRRSGGRIPARPQQRDTTGPTRRKPPPDPPRTRRPRRPHPLPPPHRQRPTPARQRRRRTRRRTDETHRPNPERSVSGLGDAARSGN